MRNVTGLSSVPVTHPRRRKTVRQKLGLILAGLVAGLLLGELALRIVGYSRPVLFHVDAERGWALRPGAEARWTLEGDALVRINGRGLRDRERAPAKPLGTVRIAILGDSMTASFEVPVEQAYPWRLEEELSACSRFAGVEIETLNFGVPGYGTAQALMTVRHGLRDYAPDIVLLAFYAGNDVRDNSVALDGRRKRPYFVIEDGALTEDDSFRSTPGFRLRVSGLGQALYALADRSRIVQVVAGVRAYRSKHRALDWLETVDKEGSTFDRELYSAPQSSEWRQAWDVTEAMIREIGREVRAGGARFGLVALSDWVQVHPDRDLRRRIVERWSLESLLYPDIRLEHMAARSDIPFLSVAPALLEHAEAEQVYLHGFESHLLGVGHYNREGHDAVARLIADWLCDIDG